MMYPAQSETHCVANWKALVKLAHIAQVGDIKPLCRQPVNLS